MTQNINNVILPFDRFEEIRDNFFLNQFTFCCWRYTSDNVNQISENKSTNSNVITLTSDCDLIYIFAIEKK